MLAALKKRRAPNLVRLERSMASQLPVIGILVGLVVMIWGLGVALGVDGRGERYTSALSPFALAAGYGCLSDAAKKRWLQVLSLAVITMGGIYLAWSDLTPSQIQTQPMRLFVRALLVLAGGMFIYGGLISRWIREKDSWLTSLREMTVANCIVALVCLLIVIGFEVTSFLPDVGCGMPMAETVAVAVVVIGMIIGLIVIAVRPKNDPFSLSLTGRMGYVYAAQLVTALLVMHLYLTMPWMFQFGIMEYWPYVAMVICFSGVGIAHLLEKRELTVLGQPLFQTAAILPVVVAACIWAVDSKADTSLVMLTIGMAYLMISFTHQSLLSGAAAVVFGNLALWLFYNKFDGFAFLDHPQLWLIPPALSALVAVQFHRKSLKPEQVTFARYICITVIYLSSTSEIFINGVGDELWPPMILAVLSVIGILSGIMFQVRAFLYMGSIFLLMSMVTMVSHAHQRLDHVWPWWAFGVGMGVAILVMFGLFEKRKNDMRAIASRLKEWEY